MSIFQLFVGIGVLFDGKITHKFHSQSVSIRLLVRINNDAIRFVSLSESERSNPFPFGKSYRKMAGPMESEGLSNTKIQMTFSE